MTSRRVLGLLFPFLLSILAKGSPVNSSVFDIKPGASIFACNSPKYWLSPSGTFAFGFYQYCDGCKDYMIGTWMTKTYKTTTLTWEHPQRATHGSSIVWDCNHGLLLHHEDDEDIMLFDNATLASTSYASMNDNGNFVLYDSDSRMVWQSFDHPTDTILSGQSLKSGNSLTTTYTHEYTLPMFYQVNISVDGNLVVVVRPSGGPNAFGDVLWTSKTHAKNRYVGLNLDYNGRLYLADKEGLVIKNLTKGEAVVSCSIVYRATMELDGVFRLYREIADEKSVVIWQTPDLPSDFIKSITLMGVCLSNVGTYLLIAYVHDCIEKFRRKRLEENGPDLEESLLYKYKGNSNRNGLDLEQGAE